MTISAEPRIAGRLPIDVVSQSPAFADLKSESLGALAGLARPRRYRKGDEILAQGEHTTSFFLVVTGRVKMSRPLVNGRSLVLALFHPGELFGAAAALGGEVCDASMIAFDNASCLEIPRDEVYALFERRPELVSEILPALTRRMVECKNCIVELTCFRVEKRFAQLLLKFAESVGQVEPGGTLIPIPLSRQELADMTGTTIETSIRIMSRWSKEHVVETRGDGFLIRDRETLEALASD